MNRPRRWHATRWALESGILPRQRGNGKKKKKKAMKPFYTPPRGTYSRIPSIHTYYSSMQFNQTTLPPRSGDWTLAEEPLLTAWISSNASEPFFYSSFSHGGLSPLYFGPFFFLFLLILIHGMQSLARIAYTSHAEIGKYAVTQAEIISCHV